ncbi:MAG: hypothetical protein DWQ35_02755 [Planctomycetota bacterium]|nr:MAG: hypothetical protein DWQ35_02755 [Planctomycetota bacterium]
MKTAEFLDLIETWGVLPPMQVDSLREQVAMAEYPVHPVLLARRLVEEGYINSYFAKTLLSGGPQAADTSRATHNVVATRRTGFDADEVDEFDVAAEFEQLGLEELPAIEGEDWLLRSAELEVAGPLPSLAAKVAKSEGAPSGRPKWLPREALAQAPWWLLVLAGVGLFGLVALLLILAF